MPCKEIGFSGFAGVRLAAVWWGENAVPTTKNPKDR
jgi:hypothetical protein